MSGLLEIGLVIVPLICGGVLAARGSFAAAGTLLLIVGCFSGVFTSTKFEWFALSLDRLTFVALVLTYALQSWRGRTDPKPLDHADFVLAVVLIVLAVSTFTADWRNAGPGGARPIGRLFAGYVVPALLYWMARQSALTEARVTLVYAILVSFGIYLAITGLLEVTQHWSLVVPRYIAKPEIGLGFGCARGPMLQPVSFGSYVAVALLTGWLWRARFGQMGGWLIGAAVPLFLVALFFTYTRSVWLGTGLGLFTVLALTLPRRWRRSVLSGVAILALLVVTANWNTLMAFRRGNESAEATRQSALSRLGFGYVSWQMFRDRPWLGVHFGHFPEAKLPYLADRSTSLDLESLRPLAQHNIFLSFLTETGLVGLIPFVALLICWISRALRTWRDAHASDWIRGSAAIFLSAMALYVGQWMFHELSFAFIDHGLLFVLAGISSGAASAKRSRGLVEQ